MSIFRSFKTFKNGIENWFSVALNMFILKRDTDCKIKNIGTVKLKKGKNYLNSSLFRTLVFSNQNNLNNEQWTILRNSFETIDDNVITVRNIEDGNEFKFQNKCLDVVFETFIRKEYKNIGYAENKTLIDVGANVGDTAIYFANKGYTVYAFEPLPNVCDIALKNISLNPQIKDKIKFINKACSCKNGFITLNYDDEETSVFTSEFIKAKKTIEVETITIEDILEEYNIEPCILKIDCEGCEVGIIQNTDLSMFDEIIFEFHTFLTKFNEKKLIALLEKQGFELNEINYHDK